MLTLYTTPLSANGRKVLAVSHQLGLEPEVRIVDVYKGEGRRPEYLAVHPLGKIPTLVERDLTLWESNAILQYLSEAHADYALWSRDPKRRADISRWLFWEASAWQPACTTIFATLVAQRLGVASAASPATVDYSDPQFRRHANFLDAHLYEREFICGSELTLADFSVAAMLTYAHAAKFPFSAFPNLALWFERIEQLDAWRRSGADLWRT